MAPGMLLVFVTGLCFAIQHGSGCVQDQNVGYIADNLRINYKVIENNYDNIASFLGQINFTNTGNVAIPNGNWAIYFSHAEMIESDRIQPDGAILGNSGLRVHHYNGILYWLEPTSNFSDLIPDQTLSVSFIGSNWMIARTDSLPNWYVVSRGQDCNDAHIIVSTVGESLDYVAAFDTAKQWKRLTTDRYDPYTPEVRYNTDNVVDRKMAVGKIMPTPMMATYETTTVNLITSNFAVVVPNDSSIVNESHLLSAKLGLIMIQPNETSSGKNVIYLQIGVVPSVSNIAGAYALQINSNDISIIGYDPSGVFYAVQSLLSLADTTIAGEVPLCYIRDSPRYEHRGQHIDVCRNFHTVDDLKRLMDAMALYKLNRLHIHMGDDEGWRLNIPTIPELTQVGSRRCHDLSGNMCLMPQLGSSPTLPNSGSGYYTVEDYKSILSYAKDRYIVVIPEFDMPGHSDAAIRSMLARYRTYNNTDPSKAEQYLLTDLGDMSTYLSSQYFTDNAINPCVNGTYNFIEEVIRQVKQMHQDIQPLKLYHIGGDEVAKGAWLKSPKCQAQFGVNVTQAQVKWYFLKRINEIVTGLDVTPVVWEDGLTLEGAIVNRTELFDTETWVNTWDNVWEWGTGGRAYAFANAGYKVVLNHATHLFFDFPAEPDPEERGYYWATRLIPLKKAFSYMPDDVYANMDVDRMGNPLNRTAICTIWPCPALDPTRASNIVGIQAQAWSETMRTSDELDYMIFPRLLALAERAWHKADWESVTDLSERNSRLQVDWEEFANTLGYKELQRLDNIGIQYRVPLVGATVMKDSTIYVTSGLPGLQIQYRDSKQETDWKPVQGNILKMNSSGTVDLRTSSADGKRYSRVISVSVTVNRVNHASQCTSSAIWLFMSAFQIFFKLNSIKL